MTGFEQLLTSNVSAVVMALLFLWYINKRDTLIQDVFNNFSGKLDKLTDALFKLERRLFELESGRDKRKEDSK